MRAGLPPLPVQGSPHFTLLLTSPGRQLPPRGKVAAGRMRVGLPPLPVQRVALTLPSRGDSFPEGEAACRRRRMRAGLPPLPVQGSPSLSPWRQLPRGTASAGDEGRLLPPLPVQAPDEGDSFPEASAMRAGLPPLASARVALFTSCSHQCCGDSFPEGEAMPQAPDEGRPSAITSARVAPSLTLPQHGDSFPRGKLRRRRRMRAGLPPLPVQGSPFTPPSSAACGRQLPPRGKPYAAGAG